MPAKDRRQPVESQNAAPPAEDGDGHDPHGAADPIHDLCLALLQPRNAEAMRTLLADLCTPAEIRSLAERWIVARLLHEGALSYREIHDVTGVSTTTITRVARFLRDEPHGGYREALRALASDRKPGRRPS